MRIRVRNRATRAASALLVIGVATLMGQDSPQPPDWRTWIQRGMEAFGQARYSEASSAFQKGSESNPASPVPHLYMALSWLQRFIPGAVSDENADCARRAESESQYRRVTHHVRPGAHAGNWYRRLHYLPRQAYRFSRRAPAVPPPARRRGTGSPPRNREARRSRDARAPHSAGGRRRCWLRI